MKTYGVIGRHAWNRRHFDAYLRNGPGRWVFVETESELKALAQQSNPPRYLFFLHWSHKVPKEILDACECVCFHMTDVPYGRGGSPLQNLITRGHRNTMLSALRMVREFDAGPVYMKVALSLEGGTAEEIYQRASRCSCEIALRIASEEPDPSPQEGVPVVFDRRVPAQSRIPDTIHSLEALFDHIRMLDAEGYPKAFLDYGQLRLEFTRAALYHDGVLSDVRIRLRTPVDPK